MDREAQQSGTTVPAVGATHGRARDTGEAASHPEVPAADEDDGRCVAYGTPPDAGRVTVPAGDGDEERCIASGTRKRAKQTRVPAADGDDGRCVEYGTPPGAGRVTVPASDDDEDRRVAGGTRKRAKQTRESTADDGDDLRIVRGTKDRLVQKTKVDRRVPTESLRRFFAALAETCNVRHSAEVAGVNLTTLYSRRRTDPAFAATWREALAVGYERLEEELLRLSLSAISGDGPSLFDPGEVINPASGLSKKASGSPDVQLALVLLNRHRGTIEGGARANAHSKRSTPEETDAYLRKQLDGLARRLRAVGQ